MSIRRGGERLSEESSPPRACAAALVLNPVEGFTRAWYSLCPTRTTGISTPPRPADVLCPRTAGAGRSLPARLLGSFQGSSGIGNKTTTEILHYTMNCPAKTNELISRKVGLGSRNGSFNCGFLIRKNQKDIPSATCQCFVVLHNGKIISTDELSIAIQKRFVARIHFGGKSSIRSNVALCLGWRNGDGTGKFQNVIDRLSVPIIVPNQPRRRRLVRVAEVDGRAQLGLFAEKCAIRPHAGVFVVNRHGEALGRRIGGHCGIRIADCGLEGNSNDAQHGKKDRESFHGVPLLKLAFVHHANCASAWCPATGELSAGGWVARK